jgi:predicted DsbA family dithiol-disulfide isomerase
MQRFAADFGVEIGQPERVPWTLKPLAATEYARDEGKLAPFRDAVMNAHWWGGDDIESDEVLARIAKQVGLDPVATVSASDDDAYLGRVLATREEAFDRMVTAIPTFLFGSYPVVGCQTYETLELVARKVGVPER